MPDKVRNKLNMQQVTKVSNTNILGKIYFILLRVKHGIILALKGFPSYMKSYYRDGKKLFRTPRALFTWDILPMAYLLETYMVERLSMEKEEARKMAMNISFAVFNRILYEKAQKDKSSEEYSYIR